LLKNKKKDSHAVNITGVKAIWIIASCITVAALILAHTFYLQSKEEIINQFNREQLMLAKEASMKMEEFYSSLERTLRLAAHLVATGESGKSSLGRLSNIYTQYKDTPLANIAVIGPGGEIANYAGGTAPGKEVILRKIYETVKGTPPGEIYVSSLQDMPRTEPGEKTEKGFFLASAARISMAPASGTASHTIDTTEAVIVFSVSLHRLLEKYVTLSKPVAVFAGIRALERSIAQPADDAEELLDGSMYLNSSDVELIKDSRSGEQIVGLRFLNIRILKGTQIRKAYLQFKVDEVSTEQTDLIIQAELAGDAVAFTNVRQNISSRKRTSASVNWSPEPWNTVGERSERQRMPDLSALIQEVVSLPDWQAGNAVVFIISGSGRRVAESYDGDPQGAPRLYIERR